jgi:cell division protein FtsI/penicillin-binding protein 2
MKGRQGTIVVQEVVSGRIVASYRHEIAARRLVAPGSTVKPFVLRQLIATGKLGRNERLACPRRLVIGGRHFDCSHGAIDHAFSPEEALAYSCNWYFSRFGTRLTREELEDAFLSSGIYGSPGEKANVAATVAVPRNIDEQKLEILGESEVRTTPRHLLNAYRQLALDRRSGKPDVALEVVFAGLEGAAQYGTARLAATPAISVAGKTGTAHADEGPWTHGWFVGYAPADNPRVAIVVYLERGHGSEAAEIAGRVLAEMQGAGK